MRIHAHETQVALVRTEHRLLFKLLPSLRAVSKSAAEHADATLAIMEVHYNRVSSIKSNFGDNYKKKRQAKKKHARHYHLQERPKARNFYFTIIQV